MTTPTKRKPAGQCSKCRNAARPARTLCADCNAKNKMRSARRYRRLVDAGLCGLCKAPRSANRNSVCTACVEQHSTYITQVKLDAFAAYGGAICKCCGETELAFLSLDHVNDDGGAHRRSLNLPNGGYSFYLRMRRANYPNDPPLQVLCMNCQFGRKHCGGVCPHQQAA